MSLQFVCCPECNSPFGLERVGVVGVKGIRDSRQIKCTYCNYTFHSKGQTIWEAMGRHRRRV